MERLIFDAHAHYNDKKFDDDREQVLSALPEKGVFAVVNNGTDYESSLEALKLADKYEYIYAAVGIHPESVVNMDITKADKYIEQIVKLLQHKKAAAIGETGLDYYWDIPREPQHIIFEKQLQLSASVNKPIIIHDREAHADTPLVGAPHPQPPPGGEGAYCGGFAPCTPLRGFAPHTLICRQWFTNTFIQKGLILCRIKNIILPSKIFPALMSVRVSIRSSVRHPWAMP